MSHKNNNKRKHRSCYASAITIVLYLFFSRYNMETPYVYTKHTRKAKRTLAYYFSGALHRRHRARKQNRFSDVTARLSSHNAPPHYYV